MSPIVPVNFSFPSIVYFEPKASQLSSTSHKLCLSQNDFTAFKSNGFPKVCAIITAFVFLERAASSFETSILYCGIVTSTNTGTAPKFKIGVTVVGKPQATVIISSPRFTAFSFNKGEVSAMNAIKFAEEPEFTKEQKGTPKYSASCFSNLSV